MENSKAEKYLKKTQDRNATLKHYVLGYVLECVFRNDVTVTLEIRKFLVYTVKVITVDDFINCLQRVRFYELLGIDSTKRSYRNFKKNMNLVNMSREEQISAIHEMQRFANQYNGIYVNSRIGTSSYE